MCNYNGISVRIFLRSTVYIYIHIYYFFYYNPPISELIFDNFDLKDAARSGRPVEANEHQIKALVEANRRITTRELLKN